MQRVTSYAKEWVCNGKNMEKSGTHFFGNGTIVGCNGTIVGSNGTVVGGTGDEQVSLSLHLTIIKK